jgi:hypothetical protein
MTFHNFLQGYGAVFTATDAFQRGFGEIQIFEIFQVLQDGLANIEGLGASGVPGELFQAFFDG